MISLDTRGSMSNCGARRMCGTSPSLVLLSTLAEVWMLAWLGLGPTCLSLFSALGDVWMLSCLGLGPSILAASRLVMVASLGLRWRSTNAEDGGGEAPIDSIAMDTDRIAGIDGERLGRCSGVSNPTVNGGGWLSPRNREPVDLTAGGDEIKGGVRLVVARERLGDVRPVGVKLARSPAAPGSGLPSMLILGKTSCWLARGSGLSTRGAKTYTTKANLNQ